MFDHLGIGVSNVSIGKGFFVAALAPLGVGGVVEGEADVGLGGKGKPALWLAPTGVRPGSLQLAFTADTRAEVDAFHRAALAAGGKDNGDAGLRPHCHANCPGAFLIGPDEHNVEAVCHAAEA